MSELLKKYIRLVVEGDIARVPNQLLSPDESPKSDSNEIEDNVQEFSSVGGGAVMGYSLPLGMNPDAAGRQKNRPRRKKKSKR
jgi:hypothetical protein